MKDWFYPAALTMVLWGLWGFIPKITTKYISPVSAVVYEVIGVVVVGIVVLFLLGFRPDTHRVGVALGISTGILGMVGALFYLVAISKGKVSVVAIMSALSPIISIGLAYFILHEPVTAKEWMGIAFALIAIVLFAS